MSARTVLFLQISLLLSASCMTGAGESFVFPTYMEGAASFPFPVVVPPVFSSDGLYGLVACGDILYYMELRHGQIHAETALGGDIHALGCGSSGKIFLLTDNRLCCVENFSVALSTEFGLQAVSMTVCGDNPAVLFTDGSLVLYSGSDLVPVNSFQTDTVGTAFIQGFPGILTLGYSDGSIVSLTLPDFAETAREKVNGSPVFLRSAGDEYMLFATDAMNEVAVCTPADLQVQMMFTFPETPSCAAADSLITCVYAASPSTGIQVCLSNGEIAWKTAEYGTSPLVVVSKDCEKALVANGNRVSLLLR